MGEAAHPSAYHHSGFRSLLPSHSSSSTSRSTPPTTSAYSNSYGRMNATASTTTTTTSTTSSSHSASGYAAPSAYTTASAYANAGAVRRRAYSAVGVSGAVVAGSSLSFPKFETETQDDALPPSRRSLQDFLNTVVRDSCTPPPSSWHRWIMTIININRATRPSWSRRPRRRGTGPRSFRRSCYGPCSSGARSCRSCATSSWPRRSSSARSSSASAICPTTRRPSSRCGARDWPAVRSIRWPTSSSSSPSTRTARSIPPIGLP